MRKNRDSVLYVFAGRHLNRRLQLSEDTAMRAQFHQPPFTKTDMSLTCPAQRNGPHGQVWGRNLEDCAHVANIASPAAFPGLKNATASFGGPRSFGRPAAIFGP